MEGQEGRERGSLLRGLGPGGNAQGVWGTGDPHSQILEHGIEMSMAMASEDGEEQALGGDQHSGSAPFLQHSRSSHAYMLR